MQIDLKKKAALFPDEPGVYMFKDIEGNVLYVGKAKSLKKRLSSYFGKTLINSKIQNMINKARYLEFIITSNEKEALLLESNLIKELKPRYNVVLRDDKRYPCIKIDLNEPFPRPVIARKMESCDGVIYFGPFHSASSLRSTLRIINKVFKLRSCKNLPKDKRPCLNYQIGRCIGPCTGNVSEKEYMKHVRNAILFLEGKGKELVQKLTNEMFEASDRLEFEKAARIRDQINAIKKVLEKQHMVSPVPENMDVIGISNKENTYQVVLLIVREGYMIGSRNFVFKGEESTPSEVIEAFLKQYYPVSKNIPDKIVLPCKIEEAELISAWLSETSGRKVELKYPDKIREKELIEIAIKNAEKLLGSESDIQIIKELKKVLHLRQLPRRIEAVDISQLKGNQAVGSIVAFLDGKPDKNRYRNFKIKGSFSDDYSMITEVIKRRIKEGDLPDLFIIDGGRAHLLIAKKAMEGIENPPDIISIAKADPDKIYLESRKAPVELPSNHPVLLFIMKIRDMVHKRAITYHRKLRSKEEIGSVLLDIDGIGPKKMKELLKRFKDIDEIMKASVEEIAEVPGIGKKLAEKIKNYFTKI